MGQFLGYIPIDSTRSTIPVNPPDSSKSTVTNTADPVPPPPSGTTPPANVIDMAPTPIPGPLVQTGPDSGQMTSSGSGSTGYGGGQPASGSILPAGFLAGKYTFKLGEKSYSVSKKVVWGTTAGVGGALLLIAIFR